MENETIGKTIDMKVCIIEPDSEKGNELGFTSELFDGYLWLDGNFMWISSIISLEPRKGNLRRLFDAINQKGYRIIVPTPSTRMKAICEARGMKEVVLPTDGDTILCMADKKKD